MTKYLSLRLTYFVPYIEILCFVIMAVKGFFIWFIDQDLITLVIYIFKLSAFRWEFVVLLLKEEGVSKGETQTYNIKWNKFR